MLWSCTETHKTSFTFFPIFPSTRGSPKQPWLGKCLLYTEARLWQNWLWAFGIQTQGCSQNHSSSLSLLGKSIHSTIQFWVLLVGYCPLLLFSFWLVKWRLVGGQNKIHGAFATYQNCNKLSALIFPAGHLAVLEGRWYYPQFMKEVKQLVWVPRPQQRAKLGFKPT